MKPHPNTDSDLTSLGEVLFQMALSANRAEQVLTRADYIERIARDLAAVRGFEVLQRPMLFQELPANLQGYFRMLAERAGKSTNPDVVSDCINEACLQVAEWMNGPGESKANAPTPEDIAREAIYRFLGLCSQVRA